MPIFYLYNLKIIKFAEIIFGFVFIMFFSIGEIAFGQTNIEDPITIDNGLVNNEVTSIHQDKYGFLWFGTRGGLSKYDGYDFSVIRYAPFSGNNLTNQAVEAIAEDNYHTLWIGTKNGGLNSYSLLKDSVKHYYPSSDIKIQEIKDLEVDSSGTLFIGSLHGIYTFSNGKFKTINNQLSINTIKIDVSGRVWVGTSSGLFLYQQKSKTLKSINLGLKNPNITSIAIDNKAGAIYLGGWHVGLLKYHVKSQKAESFLNTQSKENANDSENTYRLYLDKSRNLWVGTWGGGLDKFDINKKTFEHLNIKPVDVFNTDYDIILSIEQDLTGIIWIGTDGGGICKIDPFKKKFETITRLPSKNNLFTNTHITSVFEDLNGGLWVGTRGSGLSYSKDKLTFSHKTTFDEKDNIRAFYEDNKKDLWVGTSSGLLIYQDYYKQTNKYLYVNNNNAPNSLSGPKITAIVKDKSQIIWVGTQEHGLNKVIGKENGIPIFKRFPEHLGIKGALQNDRISCMLVDSKNRLWIGTYDGLHLYNRKSDNFYVFRRQPNQKKGLSNNTILSLTEDHNGSIWVGTQQGVNELKFINKNQVTFNTYFEQTGFPNDYIHAILVDQLDNIWMSTNRGITKFNKKTQTFRNFDKRDGVASNTFSENCSFLAKDGLMFFGGISGLTYFYPNNIFLNRYQPKVFITNLKINNKNVGVGEIVEKNKILSKSIFLTKEIELSHKEDIISLSFSALDFHASNKNQYRYKLQGFDKNWVNSGRRRYVTYTNLPSGSYTFKVMASNSDQIWTEGESVLNISILPPPWKTWWAYSIYLLIIIGLLWLSRYITLSRLNLKNKLEIADINYKNEHEITEIKSKFFSNVSHEFRTPLTLMIGPLETLSKSDQLDKTSKFILQKVQNQSKRLLSLVNQLLDFNKAENNVLTLNAYKQEIVFILNGIYESFIDESNRKKIEFYFNASNEEIYLNIDKDKIESIAYNLLSNAFKFTPNGGLIKFEIRLKNNNSQCEIIISDSGKGISEHEKSKVFDRFYQVAQAEPGQFAGTGIGLAFVKDLVELHGGSIIIEDNKPSGIIFKVSLPGVLFTEQNKDQLGFEEDIRETEFDINAGEVSDEELPILLVVEDNEELNHYICEILKTIGIVISTKNGKKGIKKAIEVIPDIIISDVMMPEADGYELCKTLKTDNRTSHIPIILLTAKSDDQSHIIGVGLGADNYLSKPFNPDVLISYVKNLIQSRKKLKELFAHRLNLEPNEVEVTSFDEEFIKRSINYIEDNIVNDDFSIDELARQLNMSRSTFYRKLKALTGMSGSDFIRLIKLKRSAQLLKTGEYSVSTAAYQAGFNDLKHFRKSFQNQFGVNPSEYMRNETPKQQ